MKHPRQPRRNKLGDKPEVFDLTTEWSDMTVISIEDEKQTRKATK